MLQTEMLVNKSDQVHDKHNLLITKTAPSSRTT